MYERHLVLSIACGKIAFANVKICFFIYSNPLTEPPLIQGDTQTGHTSFKEF